MHCQAETCSLLRRPAVLFTTNMDGRLDVFDYLYKHNDPALSVQVTDAPLTSLRVQESGRIAAVGSADGSVTLLQLSNGLVDLQPAERQSMVAVSPSPHCSISLPFLRAGRL